MYTVIVKNKDTNVTTLVFNRISLDEVLELKKAYLTHLTFSMYEIKAA